MECVFDRWMTRGVRFTADMKQFWTTCTYSTFWSLALLPVAQSRSVGPCKTPHCTIVLNKWFINALSSHASRRYSQIFDYWTWKFQESAITEINQRPAFKMWNFSLNFIKLKIPNKLCIYSAAFCSQRFSVCVVSGRLHSIPETAHPDTDNDDWWLDPPFPPLRADPLTCKDYCPKWFTVEGGRDISACHRAVHTSPALLSHKRSSPGDVKLLRAEQRFKRMNVNVNVKVPVGLIITLACLS